MNEPCSNLERGKKLFCPLKVLTAPGSNPSFFSLGSGFFPRVKHPGVRLTTDLRIIPRLRMGGTIPLLLSYALMTWTGKTLHCICIHTGCPRRNVPDFGRVFLMLKYTDITQNTYVQSWTVTEIMTREKCGLLAGPRTVPVSWQSYPCLSLSVVSYYGNSSHALSKLLMYFLLGFKAEHVSAWHSCRV